MTKQFVVLNEQDFINWAYTTFGSQNFQVTRPKNGRETVLHHDLKIHGLELHIYTTADPNINDTTRDKGEDAIRIILYDRNAGKIVHQEPKILRVEGKTSVLERLTERTTYCKKLAEDYKNNDLFCKCEKDRAHTIKRTNTKTGETFYGCSLFPLCKDKGFNKLDYAKRKYPLELNPFGETPKTLGTVTPKTEDVIEKIIQDYKKPTAVNDFKKWEVDEKKELVPTQNWNYVKYPFNYFNHVQSTVYNSQVWDRDCNVILGTATSSGKTICAEMVICAILYGK